MAYRPAAGRPVTSTGSLSACPGHRGSPLGGRFARVGSPRLGRAAASVPRRRRFRDTAPWAPVRVGRDGRDRLWGLFGSQRRLRRRRLRPPPRPQRQRPRRPRPPRQPPPQPRQQPPALLLLSGSHRCRDPQHPRARRLRPRGSPRRHPDDADGSPVPGLHVVLPVEPRAAPAATRCRWSSSGTTSRPTTRRACPRCGSPTRSRPVADAKTWTIKLKPNMRVERRFADHGGRRPLHVEPGRQPEPVVQLDYWTQRRRHDRLAEGPRLLEALHRHHGAGRPDGRLPADRARTRRSRPRCSTSATSSCRASRLLAAAPTIHTLDQKASGRCRSGRARRSAIGPYLWAEDRDRPVPPVRRRTRSRTGGRTRRPSARSSSSRSRTSRSRPPRSSRVTSTSRSSPSTTSTASGRRPHHRRRPSRRSRSRPTSTTRLRRGSQDVRVRQAFMYGCDRQGFVDSFLQGKGRSSDTYFFPDWVPKDGHQDLPASTSPRPSRCSTQREVRLQQAGRVAVLEQGRP